MSIRGVFGRDSSLRLLAVLPVRLVGAPGFAAKATREFLKQLAGQDTG